MKSFVMWRNSRDELILLDTNVFDLCSHSDQKSVATLCASSFMVAPSITLIFLSSGWLKGDLKFRYICHEVSADKFCGWSVTGIKAVTS